MLERLAQAGAVVLAGQDVVAGQIVEPFLALLEAADVADDPGQGLRSPGRRYAHDGALADPAEHAVVAAYAILAVELLVVFEVAVERHHAVR